MTHDLEQSKSNTDARTCSCHPGDVYFPCQREHAFTHCENKYLRLRVKEQDAELSQLRADMARMREALETGRPAFENLRTHQEQLDFDGSRVGVSRQALEETLEAIERSLSSAALAKPTTQQQNRGEK